MGQPCANGVLQLYNKKGGEINDEDLKRVFYIRKLIGSATAKCEFIQMTLQTVLGLCMDRQVLRDSENNVELVHKAANDGPSIAMQYLMV